MWEFCLNLKAENFDIATKLFLSLKEFSSKVGGVVTSHQKNGYYSILIGAKEALKKDYEIFLKEVLTQTICTNFKSKFLSERLILPRHDRVGIVAFRQALLNFDRETDYYIIDKSLSFEKDIFLENFYAFKLSKLKSKWTELVCLANENNDYLVSNESFFDLLKFLIDNLDASEEEVDVVEEECGYKLFTGAKDKKISNNVLSDEGMISLVIDIAPQKINLYRSTENSATDLLEKVFGQRLVVKSIGKGRLEQFEK